MSTYINMMYEFLLYFYLSFILFNKLDIPIMKCNFSSSFNLSATFIIQVNKASRQIVIYV